jgi:hypothetical protein
VAGAGVDRVLHELAEKRVRVGELPDEIVDDRAGCREVRLVSTTSVRHVPPGHGTAERARKESGTTLARALPV